METVEGGQADVGGKTVCLHGAIVKVAEILGATSSAGKLDDEADAFRAESATLQQTHETEFVLAKRGERFAP